jgi:cytochrome c oxidase subunit 1/cytochrome c oxidase subunit I+III
VAHIHYVLLGINLFPVLGGVYFWFPKMTGRMMNERLGKIGFWFTFIGFNAAFFPMHITGLLGMPRRVYTYPTDLGLNDLNLLITIGAFVLGIGLLLFFVNVVISCRSGPAAAKDPWRGPNGRSPRRRRPIISPSFRSSPAGIRCGKAPWPPPMTRGR